MVVLICGFIGASAAEVEHPRQEWLRKSTAGLFLHWGMFTAPKHLDCAQWERDVTEGGWSADYWVDEARKLGASYIVLATFHSRLGYARPWPSRVPGSCATQRDLLGELQAAGKAIGVKILLYMTDDPQWHNEQGVETLDSAAYSAYKGQQIDLTTRRGFGQYSYDLFTEVMEKYPDLGGFWIDNDNEYWEDNHLYEQIRQKRPDWLLSNNNEDTPIMDTVSNEQKTGMTPSYDYPAAAWTPMPRLVEADYKLPTTGDWWYDGGDHPVDTRLSTGRYITNAGSSIKSLMAETPMVNGRFPPQQEAFNAFMSTWVPPISKALKGTEGGGYMYGGMQPGFWNDGAHGVITVEPGARTQYVHVVTRPRIDQVRLRDNGYWVTAVKNLRTGRPQPFAQSGGHLTIRNITDWDPYDTVFQVETAGQPFTTTVKKDTDTFDIPIDLGRRKIVTALAINQREWSPTYARETFGRPEDSARIKDYRVYVSDDGKNWGEPIKEGALQSARGVRFIELGGRLTRHIRLEVLNTWAGPQAPRFYGKLLIDEIRTVFAHPFSPVRLPLEGEEAGRPIPCLSCSGGFQARAPLTFRNVTVPEAGTYRLQIDYSAAADTVMTVQGEKVPVAKDVLSSTATAVQLSAGANTVTIAGDVGVDRIAVSPLPPQDYTPRTTMTVTPSGLQWVGPGEHDITVSARFRLDSDDQLDQVTLGAATTPTMRLGQVLDSTWTVNVQAPSDLPVVARYQLLSRQQEVRKQVQVRLRPADRVFMREAEDSANQVGSAGITGCGRCSGGQKVRNLGGAPDAYVLFENVTVPQDGTYTLYVDATVNGERSYTVTVNGEPQGEVKVTGSGNSTPYTVSLPVTLKAGTNTIKLGNDHDAAPDLDRISLGQGAS
ncbi:CBM35 domain-containing protein [Nonomuraea sp. NPDC050556]|uniref:CBM35 domain-containing protein n=1 Tax=Nonomuraea sp. NPDC050556 TaxID=3364369 RepID=UPI0037A35592